MLDITGLPKNANGVRTTHTCELCGFEPKTKNKYREKQDHLVMKHFKDRIDKIFPHCRPYQCPHPSCEFTGKDKQALLRHYTGKHGVLEIYLREALAEKGIQYNISDSAKRKSMSSQSQSERKAKEARLSPPLGGITNIQVQSPLGVNAVALNNSVALTGATTTIATLHNNISTTTNNTFQHQTMQADTTTPIGGPDLPDIVFTSTITRLPPQLSTTTRLPQLSSTTTKLPQLSNNTTKLPTLHPVITSKTSTTSLPTARLPNMPLPTTKLQPQSTTTKLPNMPQPMTKLPSMPQQITRLPSMPYTNQDKFDVDALLANFQPINGQVIVSVPSSTSNLPLDSPLVSSTTPDFFLDSPKLVLNDNIMWCGGNMPAVVSDPPQTVPYFDANDLIPICDLDYDMIDSSGNMFQEAQSILTGGAGSEKQLSFSML